METYGNPPFVENIRLDTDATGPKLAFTYSGESNDLHPGMTEISTTIPYALSIV
jgi:hypothetical protein